jgi:hypothetical protein
MKHLDMEGCEQVLQRSSPIGRYVQKEREGKFTTEQSTLDFCTEQPNDASTTQLGRNVLNPLSSSS